MTRISKFFQGVRESFLLDAHRLGPRELKRQELLYRLDENIMVVNEMRISDSEYIAKRYHVERIEALQAELSKLKEEG